MFWGLVLEPGKRYSTTVEKSFHVSKAVLDCSSVRSENEVLNVILETEGSESLLCNLCKQKGIFQESLDLNFMQGDRLTFECRGNGRIHLSGYLLPDDDDEFPTLGDDEEESEEEESETSAPPSPVKTKKEKRKSDQLLASPAKKPKTQLEDEDGEEDSDEDDEDDSDIDMSDLEDLEGLGDEDEEDDEEESDEDSPKEKQKQQKKDKQNKTPNKQTQQTPKKTPVTNGVTKEQKSNKKTPGGEKSPNANTTPKHKQTLEGGVVVKDVRVGTGAPAIKGKNVKVHYVGKLKESGKVFDKNMKGDGFKFKLGKGEVIKGWEIGVQGMKVGGKRIIHCPPETAYGSKGAPPQIPANTALTFEIELKNVF